MLETLFSKPNRRYATLTPVTRKRRMILGIPVVMMLLLAAVRLPAGEAVSRDSNANPFEPTVTPEEYRILNAAMEVAATNAAEAVRRLREIDPASAGPAVDFTIGNIHFADDKLEDAANAYRAALDKMPGFRSAVLNLGRVYLMLDRPEPAMRVAQTWLQEHRADGDILVLLGNAMLRQQHALSAETAFRQALLFQPADRQAKHGLLQALLRQERILEGLALTGDLLRRDPAQPKLWRLRAQALWTLDRQADAARAIEQAHRLGGADPDMLAMLGGWYLQNEQPRDALRVYGIAFETMEPSIEQTLHALEGFLWIGDREGIDRIMARAESLRDMLPEGLERRHDVKLHRFQAEAALREGALERAIALAEDGLELDPLDGDMLLLMARLLQKADRLEDALMMGERAARIEGYQAEALVRQAQIEVARERYARAADLLEAARAFGVPPHVDRYLERVQRLAE